nr:hypothetical protein [Klebsiella pneumoniae subsp. pneumoniae]
MSGLPEPCPSTLVLSRSNAMKLTYFSRFPLLAGLMALWLSLRRAGRDRSAGCGIRPA